MPPWLQGLLGRKFHNSPVNGWLVPLQEGLQLDTSSLNCSPVSRAAFQVLQALHRAVDFKGEFRLFSDPPWAADKMMAGYSIGLTVTEVRIYPILWRCALLKI